jgi:hypothetical protein
MFFMPVDLFSSFIDGREKAIDRNWNDLNQANKVEQGWLNNDAQRWRNMFTEDTYQDKLQQYQNKTAASNMERQIAETGHAGDLMQASLFSKIQTDFADKLAPHIGTITTSMMDSALGNAADKGGYGRAQQKHADMVHELNAINKVNTLRNEGNITDKRYEAERKYLDGMISNHTSTGTAITSSVPTLDWGNAWGNPTKSPVMPENTTPKTTQYGLPTTRDLFDVLGQTLSRSFIPGSTVIF